MLLKQYKMLFYKQKTNYKNYIINYFKLIITKANLYVLILKQKYI